MPGRYHEGEFYLLGDEMKKRCLTIELIGQNSLAVMRNLYFNLNPDIIDFCFGAKGVRAVLKNGVTIPLAIWLTPGKSYWHKLIGFHGPDGTRLFIVFKADAVF